VSNLRLGAVGMAAKDIVYIRSLVRLFAHTEKLGWAFAAHPPYHAVVAEPSARSANPAFFEGFAGLVLTLVAPPGAPGTDTIAYPVQANQFRDWLKLRETQLLEMLYRQQEPQTAPPETVVPAAQAATAVPMPLLKRRFKLRRWPHAELLKVDPMRIRMATLMSRNALHVGQLATLTGRAEEDCQRFVSELHDAGLLVELVAVSEAPAANTANAASMPVLPSVSAPAAPALAAASGRRGLMASLRRHLGLG